MADVTCERETIGTETQGRITATVKGSEAGHLVFVDYDGTCQINELIVEQANRRQGIATAMVAELRQQLPESVPAQFFLNADGQALVDAIYDDFATPES